MACSFQVAEQLEIDEKDVVEIILDHLLKSYGELNISPKIVKNLTKDIFIEVVSDFIISDKISFPWKRNFIGNEIVKFQNLEKYTPQISTQPYKFSDVKAHFNDPFIAYITSNQFFLDNKTPVLIISNDEEYYNINVLSDIFQEPARLKSTAGFDHPSPLQMWKMKEYHTFLEDVYKIGRKSGVTQELLRESFYKISRLSETSTFKCSVAKSVYMLLGATRILDFSSGWGDRLLGALSLQDTIQCYIATDPNPDLYSGYREMIQLAKPENRGKFQMHKIPFEKFDLKDEYPTLSFNCIFTSPPYFDYERYGNNDSKQSINTNPNFEDWVINFLLASLIKSWSYLEENGYLALNISDSYQLIQQNKQFTEITLLLIHAYLSKVEYQGVISFAGSHKSIPRPIWIFKKTKHSKSVNINKAKECIKKYYPKIWEKIG